MGSPLKIPILHHCRALWGLAGLNNRHTAIHHATSNSILLIDDACIYHQSWSHRHLYCVITEYLLSLSWGLPVHGTVQTLGNVIAVAEAIRMRCFTLWHLSSGTTRWQRWWWEVVKMTAAGRASSISIALMELWKSQKKTVNDVVDILQTHKISSWLR